MGYSFLFAQTFLFRDADLHGPQPVSLPWTGPQRSVGGRELASLQSFLYVKLLYSSVFVCVYVWTRLCLGWDLEHCLSGRRLLPSKYLRVTSWKSRQKQNIEPMSSKGKKTTAQLVKSGGRGGTNTFSWALKRKTDSKRSKWLKWKGEGTLISKEPQSCCYDMCIR